MTHPLRTPPPSLLDGAALFLDFDGTLVELAETPGAIEVEPRLPQLLREVALRLAGRLGIISGRSIEDLERHIDCSGIAVSGSHGLELRLRSGEHIPLSAAIDLGEVRERVAAFAAGIGGLLVEDKPRSVALHYRQAPEAEDRVRAFVSGLAARTGLGVQSGKMVMELRPKGADKGDALRALMREPDFTGARPLFVGDDVTDEDAFAAAAALGGSGVLVGPERETAAEWRLPDVASVARWLGGAGR